MSTATTPAVPKTYIAKWIELDFFNYSNLKTDIQNRISVNIETEFIKALNDIRGDNKNGYGVSFSDITRLALAYFYSEIFTDKIKDSYYTVEMVKGFFDANNLTTYTAIHEIDVPFYKLNDAPLFKHCWLIIQSAWFFNSQYFGHHQHIDYLNHYITTGQKLPIDNYNFDRNYLDKKYNDIDTATTENIPINGFTLVNQWYYYILFMVCKELKLPTTHFNILIKDNREYNPLTKTSRQLRPLTPFKIIECDIKSAFPTFLDALTGAKQKDHVYNDLMKSKNISRSEAKKMYNTICNSREYKTKDFTADFFLSCGYASKHITMLLYFTHNDHLKFFQFMTRREDKAIKTFVAQNNLERGARLHDALYFIDTKTKAECYNLKVIPNCDFGYKELNRPAIKESFSLSNKRLPYAYIGSIPQGLNLTSKYEAIKPKVKGTANGFKFYNSKYEYISAGFNTNNFKANSDTFNYNCTVMFSTLEYLNKQPTNPMHVYLILKHIREFSNNVFNVRAMFFKVMKYQYNASLITTKTRDFDLIENLNFQYRIDFLNALNEARGKMTIKNNYFELYDLLQERITNNDYGFLNEAIITGRKINNLLTYAIIKKFNILCSGLHRQGRKRVKSYSLYNSSIKSVTFKCISLKPQQQNAFLKKRVSSYENELKALNRLVNNRATAQQLFLILCEVAGRDSDLQINKEVDIQNQLKAELMNMINKTDNNDIKAGAKQFDKAYKTHSIKVVTDIENVFDTDLKNSVFNHVSIEDAYYKGDIFLKEYHKYHNIVDEINSGLIVRKTKKICKYPEINFD